jgi:hypothetical protein
MVNVWDKIKENIETHFVFNNSSPPPNRIVNEIMWKNIVETGRLHMTIWRMIITCWIPKATSVTLRICNTYCFFTATMVAGTRLIFTLYVLCLLTVTNNRARHVKFDTEEDR